MPLMQSLSETGAVMQRRIRQFWMPIGLLLVSATAIGWGDMLMPGWKRIASCVRITNQSDFPGYTIIATDGTSRSMLTTYEVARPGESLECRDGPWDVVSFFAIRKGEFREAEIGTGGEAITDYFRNNESLIPCGVFMGNVHIVREDDPTERIVQLVQVVALNDSVFIVRRAGNIKYDAEGKARTVAADDFWAGRSWIYEPPQRCIRIINPEQYPDYRFILQFRNGHKLMTPGRSFDAGGKLYAVPVGRFQESDIPSFPEESSYFFDNKNLIPLGLRVSARSQRAGDFPSRITDFIEITSLGESHADWRLDSAEYVYADGAQETIPAAQLGVESNERPLDEEDFRSSASAPGDSSQRLLFFENARNFPGLLFLRLEYDQNHVKAPNFKAALAQETMPMGACVVRRAESGPRWEFDAGHITSLSRLHPLSPPSVSPQGLPMKVVDVYRIDRLDTNRIWFRPVKAVSSWRDGVVRETTLSAGGLVSLPLLHVPRAETLPAERGRHLGQLPWIWFVGLPAAALLCIVLFLLLRRRGGGQAQAPSPKLQA
jgi:hypothetical protein